MSYCDKADTTKAVYNALYRQPFDEQSICDTLKYNIFTYTSLNDEDITKIAKQILKYKEENFLFNSRHKDTEKIESIISAYVKGNRYNGKIWEPIFNNFNEFCKNKYTFSDNQWNALYGLIHQVIMSSLTDVQMFNYIEQTFPLWSGLKRILLQKRRGTNLKQWEYALSKSTSTQLNTFAFDYESLNEELKAVKNYKYMNDISAKLLITVMCKNTFPDWRIENTINGWFSNIIKAPTQHNVEKETLYKIAYAFNLSIQDFETLTACCEKAVYDTFSIEDNLYRFGMQYSVKYDNMTAVIEKAKSDNKRFGTKLTNYNQDEMNKKINNFFNTNEFSDNLIEKYLDFLNNNGVYKESAKMLASLRAENAHKYLCRLYEKFNLDNIQDYYKQFDVSNPNVSTILNEADLLEERYKEEAEKYCSYLENYIYKVVNIKKCTDSTKNDVLRLICDGLEVDVKDIASGAFSNARLNHISEKSDNLLRYPIRRSEILRLAYLNTLLSYFNYEIRNDSDIIPFFEKIANRMLSECCFLPLHLTLKLDFLMYLALSEKKRCKTNVFQTFIPRKEPRKKQSEPSE